MDIPEPKLQKRIRAIVGSEPRSFLHVHGGYTPAARWLVTTDNGRFFAKVATTPLTAKLLRREAHVYQTVHGSFMPQLIGWEDHESEPLLAIEDLSKAVWPPPWDERRVGLVLKQIEELHSTEAPLLPYAEVHGRRGHSWMAVAKNPEPFLSTGMATQDWLDQVLPALIEAESRCPTEGQTLAHCDIRSDNLCITSHGVKFVDWAEACLANPKLDLGLWLPSLTLEGGPLPDAILPGEPEVAAWVAGFFAHRAGLPNIPDAPCVRVIQRQQLTTALPWVVRALKLPKPMG